MTNQAKIINPYPGLRSFEYSENRLFFGREGQAEDVVDKMLNSHLVAVVGTSGSGKSSLVRAGVLPLLHSGTALQTGSRWRIAIMRPGEAPIRNLATALTYPERFELTPSKTKNDESLIDITDAILRRSGIGILDFFRTVNFAENENLLIVVDQFEEIFRFRDKSGFDESDEALAFVKLLLEATSQPKSETDKDPKESLPKTEIKDPKERIYIVITMRSDFLGDCAEFRELPEAINNGQYLIPRLTRGQIRDAIVSPALVYDSEISPALVNRLLADLDEGQSQMPDRMLRDRLPVLQHVLMRTWAVSAAGSPPAGPVGIPQYEDRSIGGMANALDRHADKAFTQLSPERQLIAKKMFQCLTETDPEGRQIRRAASVDNLCLVTGTGAAEMLEVIKDFRREGRTFLMPPPWIALDEKTIVDISHESLIRNWGKLTGWVKEEAKAATLYRRLIEEVRFGENREDFAFWDGHKLEQALDWKHDFDPTPEWAARYHDFTEDETRDLAELKRVSPRNEKIERQALVEKYFDKAMLFLDQSAKEEAREQADKVAFIVTLKRQRTILVAMTVSLVLMLTAIFFAFVAAEAKREAERQRETAQKSEKLALEAGLEATRSREAAMNEKANAVASKNQAEISAKAALEEKRKAEENAKIAENNKKKAEEQQKLAQTQKQRADETAVKNAQLAEQLKGQLDSTSVAAARTQTNLEGFLAFEQEDFTTANERFSEVRLSDEDLLAKDANRKRNGTRSDVNYPWWTNYNLGAVSFKLDDPKMGEERYEAALESVGYTLLEYPAQISMTPTTLFQTPVFVQAFYETSPAPRNPDLYIYDYDKVIGTLYKLATLHRERAKTLRKDHAEMANRKAAFRYQELINFLNRVKPDNPKRTGTEVAYRAKVERELGETIFDLGEFNRALELYQASYQHYKQYDVPENKRVTINARKSLSRAVAQREDQAIEKKVSAIREINNDFMTQHPLDLDVSDIYDDLELVYSQAADRVLREKQKKEADFRAPNAANSFYQRPVYPTGSSGTNGNVNISRNANGAELSGSESLIEQQRKSLEKLDQQYEEYKKRSEGYNALSEMLELFNSPSYVSLFGRQSTPEDRVQRLFYLFSVRSAFVKEGECAVAKAIAADEFKKAREEQDLGARFFSMTLIIFSDSNSYNDPIKSAEYFEAAKDALDNKEVKRSITTSPDSPDPGKGSAFIPSKDLLIAFDVAGQLFIRSKRYDRAKVIYGKLTSVLSGAREIPTVQGEFYLADIYLRLAKLAEEEGRTNEAEIAYIKATESVVSSKDSKKVPVTFSTLQYINVLIDFYETRKQSGDYEKARVLYDRMKTNFETVLKDKDFSKILKEGGFPVRIYIRVLKRVGDIERDAGRRENAAVYYREAAQKLEAFALTRVSGSYIVMETPPISSYLSSGRLNRLFYTEYSEILKLLRNLNPDEPDVSIKINELEQKIPAAMPADNYFDEKFFKSESLESQCEDTSSPSNVTR